MTDEQGSDQIPVDTNLPGPEDGPGTVIEEGEGDEAEVETVENGGGEG